MMMSDARQIPHDKRMISRLIKIFPKELIWELELLSMNFDIDTNSKVYVINSLLTKYGIPYGRLGAGTNRYAVLIDGYCFKIALDRDGKTDNKREFMYSIPLQPYVIRCYEVFPTGLIASFEYVTKFDSQDFAINRQKMSEMLKTISKSFLIGDMGIGGKNYTNWGYRIMGDRDIVILDYAYIYNLSYTVFKCECGGLIRYNDEDFNYLKCPSCGKSYSFWDIRARVPREMESKEIGDITKKGYNLTSSEQTVNVDTRFIAVEKGSRKDDEGDLPIFKEKKYLSCIMSAEDQPRTVEEAKARFLEFLEKEETENEQKEQERPETGSRLFE